MTIVSRLCSASRSIAPVGAGPLPWTSWQGGAGARPVWVAVIWLIAGEKAVATVVPHAMMSSVVHSESGSHRGRVCAGQSSGTSKVAGIDRHGRALDSANGKTAEVGAEVTPQSADVTRSEPA